MAEKSADIQTLAPRLSYVEDQAKYLMENRGSGGGADPSPKLQKLWKASMTGAVDSWTWDSEPWKADDLIYGDESETGRLSMYQTIFGGIDGGRNALSCQDGVGFYGRVFPPGETRWNFGPGHRSLVQDIFGGDDFVAAFRTHYTSICRSVWDTDASVIGSHRDDTIIGRIEKVGEKLDQLRDDLEWDLAYLENSINSQLASIRSRLAAGGL